MSEQVLSVGPHRDFTDMGPAIERVGRFAEADLWSIDLILPETVLPALCATLSESERARAARFSHPDVHRRFVATHSGLRRILAKYLFGPVESLSFLEGPYGKPVVRGGPPFSLSHAGDLALCAVSQNGEVGVDLEQLRPIPEADSIARRWFAPDEQEAYFAETGSRVASFFRLWTRREAYLKALGVGLADNHATQPIDQVRWGVHELEPRKTFVGALVVERNPAMISPDRQPELHR